MHCIHALSQFPPRTAMYSYLEIQYGGQNIISFVLSCHHSKICQKDSPHQNVFKLTLRQKSFYVFRKDRQRKFIFLLSPSLDLINIISVWALEAMKGAGKPCREANVLRRLPALLYNPVVFSKLVEAYPELSK